MKKLMLLLFAFTILMACKDKKKNDPEPTTPVYQLSVKINGTNFNCTSCGNTYASSGYGGVNFSQGGSDRLIFNITGFLAPGTYPLIPFGNPSFSYEKDGRYYRGRGSITLTETDTSANGALKKFKGSFNCITDTNNSVFYNFSEGILNINF